jgi:hypothetical protein
MYKQTEIENLKKLKFKMIFYTVTCKKWWSELLATDPKVQVDS